MINSYEELRIVELQEQKNCIEQEGLKKALDIIMLKIKSYMGEHHPRNFNTAIEESLRFEIIEHILFDAKKRSDEPYTAAELAQEIWGLYNTFYAPCLASTSFSICFNSILKIKRPETALINILLSIEGFRYE